MEIWDSKKSKFIKTPKEVLDFFNEIEGICKKYGLSISHEDSHGAFEIIKYDQCCMDWLKNAHKEY